MLKRRILKVRMNRNSEVGRQRPGRGGPDQNRNLPTSERRIDQGRIAGERKLYVN